MTDRTIDIEKVLEASSADKTYFKDHPSEPYYFRDPFPGEWQGFYLLSPLHRLTLNILNHVMEGGEGRMELKILVLELTRPDGNKMMIKWPTFQHERDGYVVMMPELEGDNIHFSRVGPDDLKGYLQEMFAHSSPEEIERAAKSQCYQNETCSRCNRIFHDGDITFSLRDDPIRPVCPTCKTDEDEVVAIGMCLKANRVRTEEEKEVIAANLVKVAEMMRMVNEEAETELQ